jgi:hypothetical protein
MKITITLDTEIPVSAASAHPKILLNNAYLDSLGIEGLRQASVGSLILLANIMPPAEFKEFVERVQWVFQNHIPSGEFGKLS